jgi:hypothetical protein
MDLTPGQQRLVFVVVVLALAGLGIYLIQGRGSGGGTPAAAPSPSPSTSSPEPSASAPSAASVPPSTVPAATPVSTAGGAQIYQWLPFTPADLSAAAQTTLTFAKDYSTWSYKESAAAYAAKMNGLVEAKELAVLKNGYSTAGVAGPRAAEKQVSTGSGTIDTIRSFGTDPTSIIFVVTINQQVTPAQPGSTGSSQYAITVISSGGSWLVHDLELSTLGNH